MYTYSEYKGFKVLFEWKLCIACCRFICLNSERYMIVQSKPSTSLHTYTAYKHVTCPPLRIKN